VIACEEEEVFLGFVSIAASPNVLFPVSKQENIEK